MRSVAMSELGSGLSLDEQWDLYVDKSSGDLASDRGTDEVEKDLAFILGRALSDVAGDFIDDGKAGDIRLSVRKLVLADDRIDTVENIDVRQETIDDELKIQVTATTVTGETIDNVFTVA